MKPSLIRRQQSFPAKLYFRSAAECTPPYDFCECAAPNVERTSVPVLGTSRVTQVYEYCRANSIRDFCPMSCELVIFAEILRNKTKSWLVSCSMSFPVSRRSSSLLTLLAGLSPEVTELVYEFMDGRITVVDFANFMDRLRTQNAQRTTEEPKVEL